MLHKLKSLLMDESGATAVEYAIVASVISIAAFSAFVAVGEQSKENLDGVAASYSEIQ